MATAYAALVSLTHTIEQSMDYNTRKSIFSHKQQKQIQSLQQKVSFLLDFLELLHSNYRVSSINNNNEAQKGLESRIADAAHAAEDIIDSHVVDTIPAPKKKLGRKIYEKLKFTSHVKKKFNHFSQGLQKIIENIDSIRKEVVEFKEKTRVEEDQQQPHSPVPIVSSRLIPPSEKDTTVEYCDNDLEQIMDKLTGEPSNLQIIPIVGMGGIGKTTLARYVYDNPLIVECFDVRAWVTVSQEYNMRELLLTLLNKIGLSDNKEERESYEYHHLGEQLRRYLYGRKYFIIMDDIWSVEACEKLQKFFPNNENGSRVVVTTRLSNVAVIIGSSHVHNMNLLDDNKSWSLLCRKMFGPNGNCPLELEEIGKDIAKNCKGLPLSIAVIGGLLSKSEMTQRYWEFVAKNINQIVNSEGDARWLKTLSLSYNQLPIHLKPCFLYMGVYPEDCEIRISKLIKLWVVEGFLKPNKAKSLEEVAEDYLKELIERNLIFVCEWGSLGKMKSCSIHDLLRDLCLNEARKERFLCVIKVRNHAQSVNYERRIVFHKDSHAMINLTLQSTPLIRSMSSDLEYWSPSWKATLNLRLLRVSTVTRDCEVESNIFRFVNLRYLECSICVNEYTVISPLGRFWCVQTLILTNSEGAICAPYEIWEMPQLRHIISEPRICLPDPSNLCGRMERQVDGGVLKNLQTLGWVDSLNCTEEILKRIPNIKKLRIGNPGKRTSSNYCCHGRLHKLQSLSYRGKDYLLQGVPLSESLKKLKLWGCRFDWDDLTEKVGSSLPHLENLILINCLTGAEWNCCTGDEGKIFLRLKSLQIIDCDDLVCWTAESSTTHFPLLQQLFLGFMSKLKEIPSDIVGDTLQSIELWDCGSSVVDSARAILEEQQNNGNEGLSLLVD